MQKLSTPRRNFIRQRVLWPSQCHHHDHKKLSLHRGQFIEVRTTGFMF